MALSASGAYCLVVIFCKCGIGLAVTFIGSYAAKNHIGIQGTTRQSAAKMDKHSVTVSLRNFYTAYIFWRRWFCQVPNKNNCCYVASENKLNKLQLLRGTFKRGIFSVDRRK